MPTETHHASVRHFRHEAKALLKALEAGSTQAAMRISAALPRLSGASVEVVLAAGVGLQEAQHVMAREQGYAQWTDLVENRPLTEDTPRFESITELSDADIRVLLREVGPQDMAAALQGLANGPVSKQHQAMFGILRQLPEAVHNELRTRIGSVKLDDVAIAEAQQRIAQQARSLRKKGLIGKPGAQAAPTDVSDLPHTDSQPHLPAGLRADLRVWDQPLDCLSIEQLRTGLGALAVAHEAGMLEATIPEGGTGCLWHGIRLTVDSVEPPLIEDIVETYAGTALRQLRLRMRLTMEAILAIAHSDNPRILPLKLAPIYTVAPDTRYRQVEGTVELALQRLERTPATLMSLDELTELFADFAWIARRSHALRGDDFLGLAEVAVAVDDEFIACGLDLLIEQGRSQRQMDDGYRGVINDMRSSLQTQSDQCLLEAEQRYRLLTAGIVAIAAGRGQQIQAAPDRL